MIFGLDRRILFWNRSAEMLYGFLENEVLGKSIYEIMIRNHDQEMFEELIQTVVKGISIRNFEFCDFSRNHIVRYTLLTLTPLYNKDGTVYQIVSSGRDITRLKNSERNLSILYSISQTLTEIHNIEELFIAALKETLHKLKYKCGMIFQIDSQYEKKSVSLVAEYYTRNNQKYLEDLKFILEKLEIAASSAQTGEMIVVENIKELTIISDEIREKLALCSITSIPLICKEKVLGIMMIGTNTAIIMNSYESSLLRNIGHQIGISLENAMLLEELKQKTQDLTTQNKKVKETNRLKSEFLANMSHELRTPLNSIIGFSGILLDGLDGEITTEQRKDLERIHQSGEHLLQLINDVLDLSKIEANRMELITEKIDLYELCLECISSLETSMTKKDIWVTTNIEPDITILFTDRKRLKQVILNVVGNAVKFTNKGSIHVTAQKLKEEQAILLSIKDTGIGIRKKDYDKVFAPFTQVDGSLTRKEGGTGLGMAISKQFLELMGGEIWFTSQYGQGTTFYIKLPIKEKQGE